VKWLKSFLLVGNDQLAHIAVAFLFTVQFGWLGVVPSFISHFPIDAIPHGHIDNGAKESVKGGLAMMLLFFMLPDPNLAVCFLANCILALIYDVFLVGAKITDRKRIGFDNNFFLFWVKMIIKINILTHWAGNTKIFKKYYSNKPEKYNSLFVANHYVLRVSWLDLGQLTLVIIVLLIVFN